MRLLDEDTLDAFVQNTLSTSIYISVFHELCRISYKRLIFRWKNIHDQEYEDIAQNALLIFIKSADRSKGRLLSWLLKTVDQAAVDYLRSGHAKKTEVTDEIEGYVTPDSNNSDPLDRLSEKLSDQGRIDLSSDILAHAESRECLVRLYDFLSERETMAPFNGSSILFTYLEWFPEADNPNNISDFVRYVQVKHPELPHRPQTIRDQLDIGKQYLQRWIAGKPR